jgi:hypothetical protein
MLVADVPIEMKENLAEILYKSDEKENRDFVLQFIKDKNQQLNSWQFDGFFTGLANDNKELYLLFSNLGLRYPLYTSRLFYNRPLYGSKNPFFNVDNPILKNNFLKLWDTELSNEIRSDLLDDLNNSTLQFYQSFYKSLDTIEIQRKALYETSIYSIKNVIKNSKIFKQDSDIPPPPTLPIDYKPYEDEMKIWLIDSLRKNKKDWKIYKEYLALKE